MKTKKKLAIIPFVFCLLIVGLVVKEKQVFSENRIAIDPVELGQKLLTNKQLPNSEKIVLKINEHIYTKAQFEDQRVLKAAGKRIPLDEVSDQEIIDHFADIIVLYDEAIRRGLEVRVEEARSYVEEMHEPYRNPDKYKDNPDEMLGIEWFIKFIESQGYTIDDYCEYLMPIYQKYLTISKLEEQISKEVDDGLGAEVSNEEQWAKRDEAIKEYKKQLREKTIIEYDASIE